MTNLYNPARTKAQGVTVNDQERVSPGYTFYTSGDGPVARLVAMDGRVVHEWRRRCGTRRRRSSSRSRTA